MKALTNLRLSLVAGAILTLSLTGCGPNQQAIKTAGENEALRQQNAGLQRSVLERDASVAQLRKQVTDLQALGPDRPVAMFAPVKLEIASLSGGADDDGKPGDDGINVYLRPKDADGDVVKVPGRMKVQLIDNSNLAAPRLIGVYAFDNLDEVRRTWHGKFGTQHFTLKCPFPGGVALPASRTLVVSAEFVDFLSGATLTASQEVKFAAPGP